MKEQRVEFEECEGQKCLGLAALFVEAVVAAAVVVAAAAAAAYYLSVTVHGQLTSLLQSAGVLNADASYETGVVWHHIVDTWLVDQTHCSSLQLLQQEP
jgi:hypothetical protein